MTMILYDTLKAARRASREIGWTYRKVSGGWLVMSWSDYKTWKKQK